MGAEGFILWGQRDLHCEGRGIYIVVAEGIIFSYFHFNTFMIIIFMDYFLNNMMLKCAFWVYNGDFEVGMLILLIFSP